MPSEQPSGQLQNQQNINKHKEQTTVRQQNTHDTETDTLKSVIKNLY